MARRRCASASSCSLSDAYARPIVSCTSAYAELEVPLLDLRETYAEQASPGRAWWALPSDAHPSPEAHALAGRTLAAWLESLDLP